MSFSSLAYILFLPAVCGMWLAVPQRLRSGVLLAASVGFYSYLLAPHLLVALGIVVLICWRGGVALHAASSLSSRKAILLGCVTAIVAVLGATKYFAGSCRGLQWLGAIGTSHACAPIVAIGVSYFAFQAISYLADIFLGVLAPERRLVCVALYLAFFPKLLQGPIERGGDLLPQLARPHSFNYEDVRAGLVRLAWGLFQKLVIADRLAAFVDPVFDHVRSHTGPTLLAATYLYALQIYYDFVGYTDMALGSARLFGIRLTPNFSHPYLSRSIAEFWRRWHISFSRCLFDYLFKPLQFYWRRWLRLGTALALVVTFGVSGLWHGATAGFLAWGALHGLYLSSWLFLQPYEKKLRGELTKTQSRWLDLGEIAFTFQLTCFAWIFFRAGTIQDAWYVVTHLFTSGPLPVGIGWVESAILLATFMPAILSAQRARLTLEAIQRSPWWQRWPIYYALVGGILALRASTGSAQFVYFKF